ncbi:GLE1-like protein-domain-containing protein [Epithele typhae]|uniref:GLE1-like protein-domain-containing protein n=1 Tax=Epithele typhae TaxID=378194 RepID=UPI0020076ECF|nr:GLE1-like protein-domain-containing protein [Epithele typhae]KAH9920021.1 GLE1-like protein-domain-containing protein [Epithele typhae]
MVEDNLSCVRRHLNHHDPYEDWQQETRQDSFRAARKKHAHESAERMRARNERRIQDEERRAQLHAEQVKEVQAQLAAMNLKRQQEESQLREQWKERDRKLWERIDTVIKVEEDRVRVKLEQERKKREEAERVQRAEEEKKRQEEERKRKVEEEARKQKEQEEEVKRKQAEAEKVQREREAAEVDQRHAMGNTTAFEDWKLAREQLKNVKEAVKFVKGDPTLKPLWSAGRRAITPKIGQLTNDDQEINRISHAIANMLRPPYPHHPKVYIALMSSLAKAILLQAETEVTAEKKSAIPLARVTTNMLMTLEGFSHVFWAKLCQRAGGWPVPIAVPVKDADDTPFSQAARRKALGYRDSDEKESLPEYITRVSGIMRVYFHILATPVHSPLDSLMRLPRYWTFFSRMLKDPRMLGSPVAPELLSTALDVCGVLAAEVWGQQWIRLLALLYEGVTTGYHGLEGQLIGGATPEGTAARVRVQLEVERIMSSGAV